MYLISKYIAKNTDVKVILSGEGSDELFGGYLYFKYAPDDKAFRVEIIDRLNELYLYDVLRADRTTAAWGLEIRPPFLDDDFVEKTLNCAYLKTGKTNTKELIRDCVAEYKLLPDEILHGKKEAFSDAVGLEWKERIQAHANQFVKEFLTEEIIEQPVNIHDGYELFSSYKSNWALAKTPHEYSKHIVPETNEMKYFQYLFNRKFPDSWHLLPHLWLPNQNWVKTGVEPSARILPNYDMKK